MDRSRLNENEKKILRYIDRVGFTSPIVLEARFLLHRNTISNVLNRLWHGGHIERPLKGLVVSSQWGKRNRAHLKEIEAHLNIQVPINL